MRKIFILNKFLPAIIKLLTFKLVTKVLATRRNSILPDIITASQAGFSNGRLILELQFRLCTPYQINEIHFG